MLNALRHHEVGTACDSATSVACPRRCSTPCGITEVGTTASAVGAIGCWSCAQRLAASLRSAHVWRIAIAAIHLECSTPCGITEVGTGSGSQIRVLGQMCSTPCGITEVGTPPTLPNSALSVYVLNALRHHRGRHDAESRIKPARVRPVLNALRHHRGRHTRRSRSIGLRPIVCSTPCGITEVGTSADLDMPAVSITCAQRLAASQRSAHRPRCDAGAA